MSTSKQNLDSVILGAGCFWCVEAVFEQVRGVTDVESGYCNGHFPEPTYEQVCTGQTGHVEVVQLGFDPGVISLSQVLQLFFATHDPTTLNRQGHDVGTQYRSGIYLHDPAQEAVARAVWADVNQALGGQVVTEIVSRRDYSRAEEYHQHYYARHPWQGYCAAVISPKLAHLRQRHRAWLRGPQEGG